MKIVCISDTHNFSLAGQLPDGDVLIHAGDFTGNGSVREIAAFNEWFGDQRHPRKIVIAGNHDRLFEKDPALARGLLRTSRDSGPDSSICYLQDSGVTIDGINFWGTPWTPPFFDWAFMAEVESRRQKFEEIPISTDVLISHGPARGYGDRTDRGDHMGCQELLKALARVRPVYHVFGHCHEGYGIWREEIERTETIGVNASICNVHYQPVNRPTVIWI